jgi:type IV secretion system protein VirD4
MDFENGHQVARYRHRLLLMLDEFATLGRLDFFQTQLSYLPGYGIKAFLIVQDLSQLYAAYGHDESIISNCHVRVAYAPNKVETARLLSDMAGSTTVHKESRTYTGNRLNPVLMHVMASEQESHRPLLTPDEAMRLPDHATLIFTAGARPILGRKLRYYEHEGFVKRARIPAPEASDRIPKTAWDWTVEEAESLPGTPQDGAAEEPETAPVQPPEEPSPCSSPGTSAEQGAAPRVPPQDTELQRIQGLISATAGEPEESASGESSDGQA